MECPCHQLCHASGPTLSNEVLGYASISLWDYKILKCLHKVWSQVLNSCFPPSHPINCRCHYSPFNDFCWTFDLDQKPPAQSASTKIVSETQQMQNKRGEHHLQSSTRHTYFYFLFKCLNKAENLFLIKLFLHFPPWWLEKFYLRSAVDAQSMEELFGLT